MWMQDKNKTAGWRPIVKRQPFPKVGPLPPAAKCWLRHSGRLPVPPTAVPQPRIII